jgi:cell division protein FtsI/penicillin-binding protein 2
MAYALDRGVVHLGEIIDCENGTLHVPGRHPITDTHPMGEVPLREVLVHSSNIGMIKVAQRLVPSDEPKGGRNFKPIIDQLRLLGFGQASGLGLHESAGTITALPNWHRNQTLTSVAFGYEIGVTVVQMAAAYSAFCNDGVLQPLRTIKEVRFADGSVTQPPSRQRRRVMSHDTSGAVLDMLRGVVDEGTGKSIEFPPVDVAGKSGTTTPPERFDPEAGRTKVASFVAFAPASNPELLVIVVAHKEGVKGHYYGATVAGPAVREIISKGLALKGVVLDSRSDGVGERQGHAGY